MIKQLDFAIHRGLSFLAKSFPYNNELILPSPKGVTPSRPFFALPLILSCLSSLKDETHAAWRVTQMRGIQTIQHAVSEDGAFNYHALDDEGHQRKYPDDLDDTALAYAAQHLYNPGGLSGGHLARFSRLLVRAETAVGGPYNTWLSDWHSDQRWHDIDPAVNANISFALLLCGAKMPYLDAYFEDCLTTKNLASRYYQSSLAVLYFISRAYAGNGKKQAVEMLSSLQNEGSWGSPLSSALAASALLRWDAPKALKPTISYLLQTQKNGFWRAEPLFVESGTTDKIHNYGSRAVTTAFCLETLSLFRQHQRAIRSPQVKDPDKELISMILERFITECRTASDSFGDRAKEESHSLLTHSFWRETLVWAKRAATAMRLDKSLNDLTLIDFGVAQLFGLVGYGLLDRIVDRQAKDADLPFAIFAARRCATYYERLWPGGSDTILARIDRALEGEAHNQVPDSLADKSLGCALPVLAIFSRFSDQETKRNQFEKYFCLLLSARQWNDDAHDYLEDIAAGRQTPVVVLLAQFTKKFNRKITDQLNTLPAKQLRQIFWERCFPEICRRIRCCLVDASIALQQSGLPKPEYFQSLIDQQTTIVNAAERQRIQALSFLSEYEKS